MRRSPIMASIGFALTIAGTATAQAQSQNVEVDVNLRTVQLRFAGACHDAGYESPNDYGDCLRAVPRSDSCSTTTTCALYERWLAACQSTWAQISDREATLADYGFYSAACGDYKPGS